MTARGSERRVCYQKLPACRSTRRDPADVCLYTVCLYVCMCEQRYTKVWLFEWVFFLLFLSPLCSSRLALGVIHSPSKPPLLPGLGTSLSLLLLMSWCQSESSEEQQRVNGSSFSLSLTLDRQSPGKRVAEGKEEGSKSLLAPNDHLFFWFNYIVMLQPVSWNPDHWSPVHFIRETIFFSVWLANSFLATTSFCLFVFCLKDTFNPFSPRGSQLTPEASKRSVSLLIPRGLNFYKTLTKLPSLFRWVQVKAAVWFLLTSTYMYLIRSTAEVRERSVEGQDDEISVGRWDECMCCWVRKRLRSIFTHTHTDTCTLLIKFHSWISYITCTKKIAWSKRANPTHCTSLHSISLFLLTRKVRSWWISMLIPLLADPFTNSDLT